MQSENTNLITVAGHVTDLFGHRFALATGSGKILADIGPKGLEELTLAVGDKVTLTGEQKPSEIKVHTVSFGGRVRHIAAWREETRGPWQART